MQDYFKPQKIVADYLYFYYRGKKFFGKGVTEWNPETGFELDIFLSQNAGLERVEARGLRVSEPSDFCSIRIWTDDFGWAIVPNFPIHRYETDLLGSGKYFSIRFNRMYFCEPGGNSLVADTYWTGNCLFRLKGRNYFSDQMRIETKIKGQLLKSQGGQGFLYEKNNYKVIGYFIEEDLFYLTWRLPKSEYTKGQAWKWPLGFQEALQIWLGKTISLLTREMNRNTHKLIEFRQDVEALSLGDFQLIAASPVQNEAIIALAKFFCKEEVKTEVEVCRNIFNQVMDANQQRSQAAQELLVATTLEATIRTLYNVPTSGQDNSHGLVQQRLRGQFKGTYLSKDWTAHCERALEAFKRLRLRNAHPDWLDTLGDPAEVEKVREAVDDMLYLCCFYGYMILAIAGFRIENPGFPTPHQQWGPLFVVSMSDDLDDFSSFKDLSKDSGYHAKMMAARKHLALSKQASTTSSSTMSEKQSDLSS